jgi:hypothetical protein
MALHKSTQVANGLPIPNADGAMDIIPIVGDFTLPAAGFATSDVLEAVPLPAGYVPVDVIVDSEDLGATITADVGILSGNYGESGARTCGAQFMAAKALGTAGIYRMDVAGGGRIAPTTNDRGVGINFSTVTTPTAGAKVRVTLLARPAVEAA